MFLEKLLVNVVIGFLVDSDTPVQLGEIGSIKALVILYVHPYIELASRV